MIRFPSSVDGTDREDRSVTMVSIVEFNCMIVGRWRLRITGARADSGGCKSVRAAVDAQVLVRKSRNMFGVRS